MRFMKHKGDLSQRCAGNACFLSQALLAFCVIGCGGNTASLTTSAPGPQKYFAPVVAGNTNGGLALSTIGTYTIDDLAAKFSQTTYSLHPPNQQGPQVLNSGLFSVSSRGLLNLGISANYVFSDFTSVWETTTYNPARPGGFAVELAGQAGGLVQLAGQPVVPLVAAVHCPNLTSPKPYQFVTIPAAFIRESVGMPPPAFTWNPTTETAYGSVDISSSGSIVTFSNIHQFTLPSVGGSGAPALPASPLATGACALTFVGNTISLPFPLIITNPGVGQKTPPSATIGIGPTGLLVADNGVIDAGQYQNSLGAGTGAVGLPKPSSPLDSVAVLGARYLGFIYGAGRYINSSSPTGWSSHIASFGFPTVPASCTSTAASTSTLIYGGDFTNDIPSAYPDGYGNCDLAIDLGEQDVTNNGLYPTATVWMGASYAANTTGKTNSFPAVAIAGKLNGKYVILLIGVDSAQPWSLYLLQSN